MSDTKKEKLINEEIIPIIPISIEGIKTILFQMQNCICKIQKNDRIGIGFLCKIPYNSYNSLLPVLITNSFALDDNDRNITFVIDNKIKKIKLDNSRKKYINPDLNIVIIEIKPNKDKIYNYLELDEIDIYKNKENLELINKNRFIYILHYYNEEVSVSYSILNDLIGNKEIKSVIPILSLKTFKVIGIYNDIPQKNNINFCTLMKYVIDEFSNYKNEINIIYKVNDEGVENIFGDKFVENNKNNIELIINGNKNNLISKYKLRKGENNLKIIIINKIKNLENMFYECKSLKNIKELEYLDTKEINNFNRMFCGCSSLSDIKGLQNWNVSNGNDFSYMFSGCSLLSDIKGIQNWNVSNGNNFSFMFYGCSSLSDIKGLEKWNLPDKIYKSMI